MPAGALTPDLAAPAWFGKVAMLGDFAHRRLAPEFVRRLDGWLAGWVVESRRALGDRWLEVYLTAPVLRFAWAPGVMGETAWLGVLMPSCDSAGRYFPLWVAQRQGAACAAACACRPSGLDDVAEAAATTLDTGASLTAFEAALAAIAPAFARPTEDSACRCDATGASTGTRWWTPLREPPCAAAPLETLPDAATLTRLWFGR